MMNGGAVLLLSFPDCRYGNVDSPTAYPCHRQRAATRDLLE